MSEPLARQPLAEAPLDLDFVVVRYPDAVLRRVAEPVVDFGAPLQRIVEAMFARMVASKGVGLAAPQVGISRRILVLNPQGERGPDDLALINPTLVERTGEETWYEEGCLSFPSIYAEVKRPDRCTVRYQDVAGTQHEREFEGFTSRIIQHEYDHLEGVLLVDRMSPADRQRHKSALQELVDRWKQGAPAPRAR
ncbi:MAG: peptide deformylase [Planctomycetota bacterium]|nr:peptide deformylase [Planctomycetota bacterium]